MSKSRAGSSSPGFSASQGMTRNKSSKAEGKVNNGVAGAGRREFSSPVSLQRIGGTGLTWEVQADEKQRQALARRFGLPRVDELSCRFHLKRLGETDVLADGLLTARVVQSCIITGEDVPEEITERFTLRFIPRDNMASEEGEIDLEALMAEEDDEVPYDGQMIDLGEAAAEQLALCLDPYPRKAGSGLDNFVEITPDEESAAGTEAPEEKPPHPFAILQKLKGTPGQDVH
ncbi:YceD family protein [Oecophyllibacter saccharovorans]|nr:DUF177 domain-containing protein [Oecophyllibacter saccharovorans]